MILNLLITIFVLIVLLIYGHKLSRRGTDDLLAIQSAHKRSTVRFGGVAIICGITAVYLVSLRSDISILILLSGLPIFIAGLLEDITGKVRPRNIALTARRRCIMSILFMAKVLTFSRACQQPRVLQIY